MLLDAPWVATIPVTAAFLQVLFCCETLQTQLRKERGERAASYKLINLLQVRAAGFLRAEIIVFHFRAFVPQASATMHLPAHIGESLQLRVLSAALCSHLEKLLHFQLAQTDRSLL